MGAVKGMPSCVVRSLFWRPDYAPLQYFLREVLETQVISTQPKGQDQPVKV